MTNLFFSESLFSHFSSKHMNETLFLCKFYLVVPALYFVYRGKLVLKSLLCSSAGIRCSCMKLLCSSASIRCSCMKSTLRYSLVMVFQVVFLFSHWKPPLCSAVYIVHHMLSALPDLPTQYQIYHQVMLHEASHMAYSPANVRTRIT